MSTAKLLAIGSAMLAAASFGAMATEDFQVASSSTMYEVDEDRDGRADRMLILEQSDALA
jgi:hypothetical protein